MKLLSLNICSISPGGCVSHAVPLGIAGASLAMLALLLPGIVRRVALDPRQPFCITLALYAMRGLKDCVPRWLLAPGAAFMLMLRFTHEDAAALMLCIFGGLGFVFAMMAPLAQLLASTLRRLKPDLLEDWQSHRLHHLASQVADYDVVCLQELTAFWGKDKHMRFLRKAAAQHGLQHFASSGRWPQFPATFAANGLAFLSRHPIKNCRKFSFSRQSWFEWSIVQRGALMAELHLPDKSVVAVLNVHTTSGFEVLESGVGRSSSAQRKNPQAVEQLLEVLDAFAIFSKDASQRIVCGDFNIEKGSRGFRVFEMRAKELLQLRDCFPNCPPTFGCVDERTGEPTETLLTGSADRCKPKVIDHVFSDKQCDKARSARHHFAKPVSLQAQGWQQVSDHSGVSVSWR